MKKSVAVLAVAVLAGTVGTALAGPAGAKSTPTTTVPKVSKCQTKTAQAGITRSMTLVLTNAPNATQYVDQGDKLAASYALSGQLDTAAGLNPPNQLHFPTKVTVTCKGSTKATFTYDLYVQDKTTSTTGAPLGLNFAGDALIKKGAWYVSALTICDLEGQAGAAAAQATNACYAAIGQTPPPAS